MNRKTRRNFLRGVAGAALALPILESIGCTKPLSGTSKRMAHFYVPNGVVRRGFFPGEANDIIPEGNLGNVMSSIGRQNPYCMVTKLNQLTPTMQPLEKFKSKITLITGMDRTYQSGSNVHAQCGSCFLSSARLHTVNETVLPLGRTLDHIVADQIGADTPFSTLEFSCNSNRDNKESIYYDNMSWYGPGHVAPSIRDPRKMYRRLFTTQEIDRYRDVTDLVLQDANEMKRELDYDDRQKFNEYFDSIRTIEKQMDQLHRMKIELAKAGFDQPTEAYLPRGEYIRLMGDLMVVALQTGLTNVATFMVGPENWNTPVKFEDLFDEPRSHHEMSHNQTETIEDLLKIDHFYMEQFAYIVGKMDAIKEPDGTTLLDNTLFTYGSGLGDGSTHQYNDLPIVVAGGGKRVLSGHHLNMPDGTPLANLWLTQARMMGLDLDSFADSNGSVDQFFS